MYVRTNDGLRDRMFFNTSLRLGSATIAAPRVLTYSTRDVIDSRISVPAQHSLVRLSKNPATSSDAVAMLEEIKARRLAGIYCVNWKASAQRAIKLGKTWWTVIPREEDAILMLDPANLSNGPPLIAFRRELDHRREQGCGLLPNEQPIPPSPARLDAALLKAWSSYRMWQGVGKPNGTLKCTIKPTTDQVLAGTEIHGLSSVRTINNVIPRLFCSTSSQPVPECSDRPCLVGPCLTHFHVRKVLPTGKIVKAFPKMCLEFMNPGFIDLTDKVIKHKQFQSDLENQLKKPLYKTLTSSTPKRKPRFAVAVVDLTGDKLFAPEFAGLHETDQFFGASVPKIAILYAAFQLQHDLNVFAFLNRITTKADVIVRLGKRWEEEGLKDKEKLQANITGIFDFTEKPPAAARVTMKPVFQDLLCCTFKGGISCNRTARILMGLIGFEYISSLVWQSGLFHKTRGGLWLHWPYPEKKDCPEKCDSTDLDKGDDKCFQSATGKVCNDLSVKDSKLNFKAVDISSHPQKITGQNVTALSAATYFTLMAQERLVAPGASRCIKNLLSHACTFFAANRNNVTDDFCRKHTKYKNPALPLTTDNVAVKCGSSGVRHDCILVERTSGNKNLRYVVALLTENVAEFDSVPVAKCFFRNQFLIDVDQLIQQRNR